MVVLAVAAASADMVPAILFNQANRLADFGHVLLPLSVMTQLTPANEVEYMNICNVYSLYFRFQA